MKTSSFTLIPSSTFGTDIDGTPQKAASYYTKDKGTQTLSWFLTGFVGLLTIEATLDSDNTTSNYSVIHTIEALAPLTENDVINLAGNYTWIKAVVVNYTAGSIQKVSLGY